MTDSGPFGPQSGPLGEALHSLRMNGGFYSRAHLTAPWGMSLEAMPGYMWFHVPTTGEVWVETEQAEPARLRSGELALVPHGDGHRLRNEPGAATPDIRELDIERVSDRYEIIRHGGGGEPTTLICGAVRFDHPVARNLVQILPPIIHIKTAADSAQVERMQGTLRLLAVEAREARPGGEAVITRLADILVIQAIRAWIETDPVAQTGWLGALQDPQIGRAISLVHRQPAHPWTLDTLAAELAMSRSAFAARFTQLVDEPAMQYATRWRMNLALDALRNEDATIAQLAHRLGYRSEAAFARAFKRQLGSTPGTIKRRMRVPPPSTTDQRTSRRRPRACRPNVPRPRAQRFSGERDGPFAGIRRHALACGPLGGWAGQQHIPTWASLLAARDRAGFVDELGRTLVAASAIDNFTPVAQLLWEWRATAEIHADPRLARRLRRAITAIGDRVVPPSA